MRAPEFWKSRGGLAAMLSPAGVLYGASVAWKRMRATPHRPRARVICVGNLTAGGSGKTPVAIEIAKRLKARGLNVVFLSRGYGGSLKGPVLVHTRRHSAADVGDEPLLLARTATTIVARGRKQGADLADGNGADIIVMDDGHQNFALQKDLSLVVVDAESGFGNRRMVPAGPLREPVAQGLARADAVILAGKGTPSLDGFDGQILRAHLTPAIPQPLAGQRVIAFAGIGRPEKFFASLRAQKVELAESHIFADHHRYTARELAELREAARGGQLVTTEKDLVRLPVEERGGITAIPLACTFEDSAALERLLDRVAPVAIAAATS